MHIPNSVLRKVQKSPLDNNYFYHAEEAWTRLSEIRLGNIPYICDDFSLLVNTIERYYKGFIAAKIEDGSLFIRDPDFLKSDHNLNKLVVEIERFIELTVCNSPQEFRERRLFLNDLRKAYVSARYSSTPSFDEFKKVYEFAFNQREIILNYFRGRPEPFMERDYEAEEIDDFIE